MAVSAWVVTWDSNVREGQRTGNRFQTEREAWAAYWEAERNGRNPSEPYVESFDAWA